MESSLQILLTSNDGIIRTRLEDHLRNLGHQVEATRDGNTTLNRIRVQNYDLVLVNLRTPNLNGIELLTKIQKYRQNMPVVLISGKDAMKTLVEAFRLDAAAVPPQPIQFPNGNTAQEKGRRSDELHWNCCTLDETLTRTQGRKNLQAQDQRFVGDSPSEPRHTLSHLGSSAVIYTTASTFFLFT